MKVIRPSLGVKSSQLLSRVIVKSREQMSGGEAFSLELRTVRGCSLVRARFTQSVSDQWFENRGFTGEVAKPS